VNLLSWIILALTLAWFIWALLRTIRKKGGCSCGGENGCTGRCDCCSHGCCTHDKKDSV